MDIKSLILSIEDKFKNNQSYVIHRMKVHDKCLVDGLTKHFESSGYDVVTNRCSDKKAHEMEIIHPQREALSRVFYFEQKFLVKMYLIIPVPEQKRVAKAFIDKLKTQQSGGYQVDVFLAECYHRAHCDTSSIKCRTLDSNYVISHTYCTHMCDRDCKSGQFMKITHLDQSKDPVDRMFAFIQRKFEGKDKSMVYYAEAPADNDILNRLIKMLKDRSYSVSLNDSLCVCKDEDFDSYYGYHHLTKHVWMRITKSMKSSL